MRLVCKVAHSVLDKRPAFERGFIVKCDGSLWVDSSHFGGSVLQALKDKGAYSPFIYS